MRNCAAQFLQLIFFFALVFTKGLEASAADQKSLLEKLAIPANFSKTKKEAVAEIARRNDLLPSDDVLASLPERVDFQIRYGVPDSDAANGVWEELKTIYEQLRTDIIFFNNAAGAIKEAEKTYQHWSTPSALPRYWGFSNNSFNLRRTFESEAFNFKSRLDNISKGLKQRGYHIVRGYQASLEDSHNLDFDDSKLLIVQSKLVPNRHPAINLEDGKGSPDILDTPGGNQLQRDYLKVMIDRVIQMATLEANKLVQIKSDIASQDLVNFVTQLQALDLSKSPKDIRDGILRALSMPSVSSIGIDEIIFDSRLSITVLLENRINSMQIPSGRSYHQGRDLFVLRYQIVADFLRAINITLKTGQAFHNQVVVPTMGPMDASVWPQLKQLVEMARDKGVPLEIGFSESLFLNADPRAPHLHRLRFEIKNSVLGTLLALEAGEVKRPTDPYNLSQLLPNFKICGNELAQLINFTP